MSNQTGDRYTCTDPNCGCEIRIERPSNSVSAVSDYSSESNVAERDQELRSENSGSLTGNFRRETTSTPGDFGAQGATGEGTFGTSSTGGGSSMMSGRYDTPGNFIKRTPAETSRSAPVTRNLTASPTCLCGSPMKQVGTGTKVAAARADSCKFSGFYTIYQICFGRVGFGRRAFHLGEARLAGRGLQNEAGPSPGFA